jgi:hypothetical protein
MNKKQKKAEAKARADALEQGRFDPNPDDKKNSEDDEEEVEEKEEGEESASESEAGTEYDSDGHCVSTTYVTSVTH